MTADRAGYIAGLRHLADILEEHDDLPLPFTGTKSELLWIESHTDHDQQEVARTFVRAIPGTVTKQVRGDAFDLVGHVDGLSVQMILNRDAVCERVVTGVETVTRTVSDPEALAAVPTREVTETVETVEWRCAPILAGRDAAVTK